MNTDSQTIVIKLGTSVLTSGSARLDRAHMVEIVRQCAQLHTRGHQLIIVTSGAIAAGKEHLDMQEIEPTIANKQMLAAVGQGQLIREWENLFNIYNMHIGQMLLTRADLDCHERYLNARDTIQTLLKYRIIPIINENDAVATLEIKVGDNDNLSALVALLADAQKLLLLTDQQGLFTADPRSNPKAKLIPEVSEITKEIVALAGDAVSGLGTGGMATKISSASIACRAGVEVIIASGHRPNVILDAANNLSVGTRFNTTYCKLESRENWIFAGSKITGKLVIDEKTKEDLIKLEHSLLPTGIIKVINAFERGSVVSLINSYGLEIARGISHYNSNDLNKIKGIEADKIVDILGYEHGLVVIDQKDLVLL